MIDLPIKIENTLNWSLVIAIIGAIAYYFGKLISEAKPLKEKKEVNYIEGIFFLMLFILFPLLIYYASINKDWRLNWISFILLFIQYSIMQLFHQKKIALDISKVEKENLYEQAYNTEIDNLKNKSKWLDKQGKNMIEVKDWFSKWIFKGFGKTALYILSLINLFSFMFILSQDIAFLYKGFSIFIFFLSLSYTAIFYSSINSKPFNAILHLENGENIKGKILKIDEDFVNILSDKKVFHVYSDKITSIERVSIPNNQIIDKVVNKK